jgi:hypothetical protein
MAEIPDLPADVYFGDPDKPLPNWREVLADDASEDDEDDDELSDDERATLMSMLGFDPQELDD